MVFAYTTAGRLKEIRHNNGIITQYAYDEDGNISHLCIENEHNGDILYNAFMLYDLNGNRIGKSGERTGGRRQETGTEYSLQL